MSLMSVPVITVGYKPVISQALLGYHCLLALDLLALCNNNDILLVLVI